MAGPGGPPALQAHDRPSCRPATAVPEKERALHDGYPKAASAGTPALIGYTVLLDALPGTTVDTTLMGPDGRILFRNRRSIEEGRARYFAYASKRRGAGPWMPGAYRTRFLASGVSQAGPFQIVREAQITLR